MRLIREHKNIETILQNIGDKPKWEVPADWLPSKSEEEEEVHSDREDPDEDADTKKGEEKKEDSDEKPIPTYVQARKLFNEHEVLTDVELKWKPPQKEELSKFLVDEMNFNADRVASSIDKLEKAYKTNLKPQTRMDSFFKVKVDPNGAAKRKKRQEEEKKKQAANKKAKKGPVRKRR